MTYNYTGILYTILLDVVLSFEFYIKNYITEKPYEFKLLRLLQLFVE